MPETRQGRKVGVKEILNVASGINDYIPSSECLRILKKQGRRIMVVGDLMLDRYIRGRATRISPEAPVPVVLVEAEVASPGGAANVACNLRALGAEVMVGGVLGCDYGGRQVADLLAENGISCAGVVSVQDRPTTTKCRVVAGPQQVVRLDWEDARPVDETTASQIMSWANEVLPGVDGVVISDYAKGCLTEPLLEGIISLAGSLGRPVIVDPKGRDYTRYRGCTTITPNLHEAEIATGIKITNQRELVSAAKAIMHQTQSRACLLTQGADGMTLVYEGGAYYIPALTTEVFDVTGAGDTVVAGLAVSLASGLSLMESAVIANFCAAIVVRKRNTAVATLTELEELLRQYEGRTRVSEISRLVGGTSEE